MALSKTAPKSLVIEDYIFVNGTPVLKASLMPTQSGSTSGTDTKDTKTPTDTKDEKVLVLPMRVRAALNLHRLKNGNKKSGGKGMSDPITAKIASSFFLTSAANTALTQVQALSPYGGSDFSSFAAVFDLWRLRKVTVHARLTGSAVTGNGVWGMALDPSNIGAYSSTDDILTAKYHKAPMIYGADTLVWPRIVNNSGFITFSMSPPEQRVTNDGTAALAVGGGWVGTSNTTAVCGWFKPYVGSFGIGNTSTLEVYAVYEVEFKSRT